MMITALLIAAIGLVVLASASNDSPARFDSQLMNMGVALVLMWVVAQIPPQTLMHLALPIYVGGVLLLIAVALFGDVTKGARRWLNLGFTRIQPSEIMKIAMPLMLAWYFHKREALLRLRDYGVAALILLGADGADRPPARPRHRHPGAGGRLLCDLLRRPALEDHCRPGRRRRSPACPLVWSLLHDYQRNRILTLLDPEQDPLGKGFHIIQSTIAIGSGGIIGKGWLHGTPGAPRIHSGTPHRLHLRRAVRGVRPDRQRRPADRSTRC